jgi:hypothetical protein
MNVANHGLQDPTLVQRAVLKQISAYTVDIPLQFALQLLFFAGATSLELMPIQDQMFSATSWHYLSTALFKSWLVGRAIGMLADGWVNLQIMYRQSEEFGQVPDKSEKSFMGWFYKNGWKAKENSLAKNWADSNSLLYANMRSALSLAIVKSVMIFGRWDLDLYLIGYFSDFATPVSGINYKGENAFERSSDYYFKYFDEDIRKHPRVIEWVSGKKSVARLKFNFLYRLLIENPLGFLIEFSEVTAVSKIGPRSLTRVVFNGTTPTIIAKHTGEWLSRKLSWVPGAPKAIDACVEALTRRYPGYKPGEG